jgi:thiaminase/transcriptional activator TenA
MRLALIVEGMSRVISLHIAIRPIRTILSSTAPKGPVLVWHDTAPSAQVCNAYLGSLCLYGRSTMAVFSEMLRQSVAKVYDRILAHPFVTGLTDGSLPEDVFRFYAVQDALYLRDFARGLALLAARSPADDALIMFCEHAKTALVAERAMHESFFDQWGLGQADVYATPPAPTNLLYTSYLLRVAYERPFAEGMGAFLPCYWIYWEVGKELERRGSPVSIYQRWIDTYASEEFGDTVRQVVALMNRVAETLTAEDKTRIAGHFVMTSRFEYMFWDMAYRRQTWEI